jgi:hypothetical protein
MSDTPPGRNRPSTSSSFVWFIHCHATFTGERLCVFYLGYLTCKVKFRVEVALAMSFCDAFSLASSYEGRYITLYLTCMWSLLSEYRKMSSKNCILILPFACVSKSRINTICILSNMIPISPSLARCMKLYTS